MPDTAPATGTIQENGAVMAQLQIVASGDDSRRVQLYSQDGHFLCEAPFTGDDEAGYAHGYAMFLGYRAGWANADLCFSRAVHKAISQRHPLEV